MWKNIFAGLRAEHRWKMVLGRRRWWGTLQRGLGSKNTNLNIIAEEKKRRQGIHTTDSSVGSSRVDSEACRHGSGKCIGSSVPTPQARASQSLAFPRVWAWVRQGGKSCGAQSLFTVCLNSSVFLLLCYFLNLSVFFSNPLLILLPCFSFPFVLGEKAPAFVYCKVLLAYGADLKGFQECKFTSVFAYPLAKGAAAKLILFLSPKGQYVFLHLLLLLLRLHWSDVQELQNLGQCVFLTSSSFSSSKWSARIAELLGRENRSNPIQFFDVAKISANLQTMSEHLNWCSATRMALVQL